MARSRSSDRSTALITAARRLNAGLRELSFAAPVEYVYAPLDYAWTAYRAYLASFATNPKRVVFLGMNPGPWGMAQTGVPFGEVTAVRDWLGIEAEVGRPVHEHPRRPVLGFAVGRREASGRRLWSLMRERFGSAAAFFRDHFLANYCPLLFLDREGGNLTPDRLRAAERQALFRLCDRHLERVLETLEPEWAIGIGRFSESRLRAVRRAAGWSRLKVEGILHPSPASPQANRGWAARTTERLVALGVWPS